MKQNWWKWLALLLLLFSATAGLLIPLSPGIYADASVSPAKPFSLEVTGYNTRFKSNENSFKAWLSDQKHSVCASSFTIVSEDKATLQFPALANNTQYAWDLYVSDKADGTMNQSLSVKMRPDTAHAETPAFCATDNTLTSPNHASIPNLSVLYESIRNLFFHVPMWFTMILLYTIALISSFRYLRTNDSRFDRLAAEMVNTGIFFSFLGLMTGSLWARFTWGTWWTNDTKLNGAAIAVLAYLAYAVLRRSIDEEQKRARIAAVYNIFAYVLMLVFVFILPRLNDSLHPGNGGNPAFGKYDLNNTMRPVFYAAVIGWMLTGTWIALLRVRMKKLSEEADSI